MGLPILFTPRLTLRPWVAQDIDALHALFIDPDVRKYLWDDVAISRERVAEAIESHLALTESHNVGYWITQERERNSTIGFCGFRFFEDSSKIELLYGLLPEYWGRGFATESSRAALDHLWRAAAFQRVLAQTDIPNDRSVRVLQRLGMRLDSSTKDRLTYLLERPA